MAIVERDDAVINAQLLLRVEFGFDRLQNLFDPDSFEKIEILDNDGNILQTILGASVVKTATGKYYIITTNTWNTVSRNVRDRWYYNKNGTDYESEENTFIRSTVSTTDGMSSFVSLVKKKVKDDKGVIADPADYETFIQEALKHYSKLRPVIEIEKLTGDGNSYFAIPTNFEYRWSWIHNIEFPLDGFPPWYIDPNGYKVEETDAGVLVRFTDTNYPGDGDNFIFRYARRHTITDTANTLNAGDKDAFCNLAGYYCCIALSNYYSQTQDSTLEADVIAYRTKGDEFATRAQNLLKAFKEVIKPDQSGVIGEWDLPAFWDTNFLFRDRDFW